MGGATGEERSTGIEGELLCGVVETLAVAAEVPVIALQILRAEKVLQ